MPLANSMRLFDSLIYDFYLLDIDYHHRKSQLASFVLPHFSYASWFTSRQSNLLKIFLYGSAALPSGACATPRAIISSPFSSYDIFFDIISEIGLHQPSRRTRKAICQYLPERWDGPPRFYRMTVTYWCYVSPHFYRNACRVFTMINAT